MNRPEEIAEKNLKEFERIAEEMERYEQEKQAIVEQAKKLGINLDMEIPWDQLTDEQRKQLEEIRLNAEREMSEVQNIGKPKVSFGRGIRI